MRTWLVVAILLASIPASTLSGAEEITWRGSGKGGAVAAGREEAVAAGLTLLEQGGNAADAAAATLLAKPPCETRLSDIGVVVQGHSAELLMPDGQVVMLPPLGYEHQLD